MRKLGHVGRLERGATRPGPIKRRAPSSSHGTCQPSRARAPWEADGVARAPVCQAALLQRPPGGSREQQGTAIETQFRALLKGGGHFHARAVLKDSGTCRVEITLSGHETEYPCLLHWGLYRSTVRPWLTPADVIPHGSTKRDDLGAVHTPMAEAGTGASLRAPRTATLEFPLTALPATLACSVFIDSPGQGHFAPLARGQHLVVPLGMAPGSPAQLGVTLMAPPQGAAQQFSANFAVVARHPSGMTLRLLRLEGSRVVKILDLALDPEAHRTGDVWHVEVHSLKAPEKLAYMWLASGEEGWRGRARFSPGTALLDPYAKVAVRVRLPESEHGGREVIAGSMIPPLLPATWRRGTRPRHAQDASVFLEVDPATFAAPGSCRPGHEGKWAGVLDRLHDITDTGSTAVVLACPMMRGPGLGVQGLAGVSYFAPDPCYAVGTEPGAAGAEFAALVRGLHAAGLEVMIQVEFCFTVEGDDLQPRIVGMRGLDAQLYYRPNSLLNLAHPVLRRLVVDALRHWAITYHVDGFCLLSAESLAQDTDGLVLDCPALVQEVGEDPALRGCKLSAWPRDAALLPRQGRRGFPHAGVWMQHNAAFGAVLAWLGGGGEAGILTRIATLLTGSADVFQADWSTEASLPGNLAASRRPSFGFNLVSAPIVDGTSLRGWVDSILGEGNNCPERNQLTKTALMLLMLSQGSPQLAAADVQHPDVARFVAAAREARAQTAELLQPPEFETVRDVRWFNEHGHEPDWASSHGGVLGFAVRKGGIVGTAACLIINPTWETSNVSLPPAPAGGPWRVLLDSAAVDARPRTAVAGGGFVVGPKAAVCLMAGTTAARG